MAEIVWASAALPKISFFLFCDPFRINFSLIWQNGWRRSANWYVISKRISFARVFIFRCWMEALFPFFPAFAPLHSSLVFNYSYPLNTLNISQLTAGTVIPVCSKLYDLLPCWVYKWRAQSFQFHPKCQKKSYKAHTISDVIEIFNKDIQSYIMCNGFYSTGAAVVKRNVTIRHPSPTQCCNSTWKQTHQHPDVIKALSCTNNCLIPGVTKCWSP